MTMQELKNKAVQITDRMEAEFPIFSRNAILLDQQHPRIFYNLKGIVERHPNMHFSYQNGVYAFIDECNNLYAIPDLSGVYETLIGNGYATGNFYVPFALYEVPVEETLAAKWEALQNEYKERFKRS